METGNSKSLQASLSQRHGATSNNSTLFPKVSAQFSSTDLFLGDYDEVQ